MGRPSRGAGAEDLACRYLGDRGLKLLERNYRCPFGEIDLILDERGTIVFVEVRQRQSDAFGAPAETVDFRKQAKLRASAEHYLQRVRGGSKKEARFDIVAIHGTLAEDNLEWLQNVF